MSSETTTARRLKIWSALNFLSLLVLWTLENFTPEKVWPVTLLTFAPQPVFLLPTLALGVLCLRRKKPKCALLQIPALLWAGLVLLGFNLPHNAPASAPTLRVMTYNIRFGSLGIERIVDTIRNADPQVLCVQEARRQPPFEDPVPLLKAALPEYHFARFGELSVFSKYRIFRQYQHRLRDYYGSGILEAQLDVEGKIVTVFCAHFTNPIDGKWRKWPAEIKLRSVIREKQCDLLNEVAERAQTPYFICGDFNTPPRGELYRRLSSQFNDGFRAAGWSFGNSFPSHFPVARLDYIWTNDRTRAVSCRVLPSQASDHRALLAEVEISNANGVSF